MGGRSLRRIWAPKEVLSPPRFLFGFSFGVLRCAIFVDRLPPCGLLHRDGGPGGICCPLGQWYLSLLLRHGSGEWPFR